jgi:thiol-disulfide isomerase/thioredoxin
MPWMSRFQALTHLKNVSDADVEAAADKLTAVDESNHDVIWPASMSMAVAAEFVKRGIRLESIPQLVESGIEQAQKQTQLTAHTPGIPPEAQQMMLDMVNSVRFQGWSVLVDYNVKTKQPDKAREILVKMGAFLSENKPAESAKPLAKLAYTSESRNYWEKMASLAEAQNRKMDAMGYYLNALDIPRQRSSESAQEDETAQKARQLWKSLGGTNEGWSVWASEHMPPATPAAGVAAWSKLDKPLPDFSLPDLSGHTWRLEDLKGKVTFLNVWATWCGPCQAELPLVQKLFEKMKDNPNVLVLSLNIDENPGLIDPFLRKSNYTFPVIPASSLFAQIDQFMALPKNWIVDGNGTLRREQLGFAYKEEQWLKNATQTLEEMRAGK